MLKLNSSDSELEFTSKKKTAHPPNLGKNKKKGKSKAKPKSKNQGESNQGLQEPISTVPTTTTTTTTADSTVKVEDTDKPSTRHQMGSSFENNTEKLDISSSSTSEEESDSSDEEFLGRRAIGIDPTELENFDGTSAPVNGSQYLMMVMNERGNTPKVAVSSIAKNKTKKGLKLSANYVEKFKEGCADGNLEAKEFMSSFSPTTEWRDTNVREFSLLRCKVERWRELLQKRVTRLKADSIKLPEIGNKVVWLKFCFGIKFEELVESRKGGASNLSVHKIVEDYFTDFKKHTSRPGSIITLPSPPDPESASTNETPLSPRSITTSDVTSSSSPEKLPISEEHVNNDGCQPLMSLMLVLTQPQIENLIYFQADWITRFGFANKCQGEWLYALLACIDKPVDPSTMGDVRNICKTLVSLRSQYCAKLKHAGILLCEGDNDEIDKLSDDLKEVSLEEKNWGELDSQASEYLNALNLFIYLIGDYFCQKDLVEGL